MRLAPALVLSLLACSEGSDARIEVEGASPVVQTGQLSEAVGIETLGGVFTPVLRAGCAIPCENTNTFATAADGQTEIPIALYRGTAELAAQNHSLGRFAVRGIPAAPRGEGQVDITFRADSTGITLSAREVSGAPVRFERQAD